MDIVKSKRVHLVTWAGSATSAAIEISAGRDSAFILELPSTFAGTALSYRVKNAAGAWVPLHIDGASVADVVAGSTASANVLSRDLYGVTDLKIVSNASETCSGNLICSS